MSAATGTGTRRGLRWARRAAGVGVAAALSLGTAPGTASAQPVAPSDGQISAAQQAAADATARVGQISAQLATAQAQVDAASAASAIALDTYEGKQEELRSAQSASAAADADATRAAADLAVARAAVASFARTSYVQGSTDSRLQSLVTSGSPSQLLERAALLDAAGDHRSDVVDQVTVVEHRAATAAAAAKDALAKAADLERQAEDALAAAEAAERSARGQAAAFATQQTELQAQLQQAQQTLTALQGQRAAADAYARAQASAQAAAQAAARAAAARTAAAAPAARPVATLAAGRPSGSAVETAIAAAQRWIGTRYAWGGGSLDGPSEGFGIDDGVVGFDCSGLTRYAYAQAGISLPRQSTVQYAALAKVSRADLQRGDLVFWATDTSDPATVHHVAIYLGNGQVLEAPESGLRVRVAAMRWAGYIGAVRPSA